MPTNNLTADEVVINLRANTDKINKSIEETSKRIDTLQRRVYKNEDSSWAKKRDKEVVSLGYEVKKLTREYTASEAALKTYQAGLTKLGVTTDSVSRSTSTLARSSSEVAKSLKGVTASTKRADTVQKSLNNVYGVASSGMKIYAKSITNVQPKLNGLTASSKKAVVVNKSLNNIYGVQSNKIKEATTALNKHTAAQKRNSRASQTKGTGTANGREGFFATMFEGAGTTFGHKVATTAQYATAGSGIYAVATAFKAAGAAALEFNKSVHVTAAVLDVTIEQATGLGHKLESLSVQFGGNITEINQAAIALGRAGLSFEDIADGTQVVINMAMLTGDSIADATSAISSYRQVFADSGHTIMDFGNQLAYMANKSRLSTQDIGTFSNYALAAAKSLGLASEQVGGLATAFSNFGLNASTIGTQIRKLAETVKTETAATEQFFTVLGVNQTTILNRMQAGGEVSKQAFVDLIKEISNLSQSEYNAAVSKLPLLQKNVFDTIRKTGDQILLHTTGLFDKESNKALEAANTIAVSHVKAFERIRNAIFQTSTAFLDAGLNTAMDTFLNLDNTEEFEKSLAFIADTLGDTARAASLATIAWGAYNVITKLATATTITNTGALVSNRLAGVASITTMSGLSAALTAATLKTKAFTAALLANPLGLVFTVATTAAIGFMAWQDRISDKQDELNAKLDATIDKQRKTYEASQKALRSTTEYQIEAGKQLKRNLEKSKAVFENLLKTRPNSEHVDAWQEQLDKIIVKLSQLAVVGDKVSRASLFVSKDDISEFSSYVTNYREMVRVGKEDLNLKTRLQSVGKNLIDNTKVLIKENLVAQESISDSILDTRNSIFSATTLGLEQQELERQLVLETNKEKRLALQIEINNRSAIIKQLNTISAIQKYISSLDSTVKDPTMQLRSIEALNRSLEQQVNILSGQIYTKLDLLEIDEQLKLEQLSRLDFDEQNIEHLKIMETYLKAQVATQKEVTAEAQRSAEARIAAIGVRQDIALMRSPVATQSIGTLVTDTADVDRKEQDSITTENNKLQLLQMELGVKWDLLNAGKQELELAKLQKAELEGKYAIEQAGLDAANKKFELRMDYQEKSLDTVLDTVSATVKDFKLASGTLKVAKQLFTIGAKQEKIEKRKSDLHKRYLKDMEEAQERGEDTADLELKYTEAKAELDRENIDAQIAGFGQVAGAMAGMFEAGSDGAKIFMGIQQALAVVSAARAMIEAWASPWYIVVPRVAATAAAVAGLLKTVGASSSGLSGITKADTEAQAGFAATELSNDAVTNRLDQQIELLESIDRNGSASALAVELAEAEYKSSKDKWVGDVLADARLGIVNAPGLTSQAQSDIEAWEKRIGVDVYDLDSDNKTLRIRQEEFVDNADKLITVFQSFLTTNPSGFSGSFGQAISSEIGFGESAHIAFQNSIKASFVELQGYVNDWAVSTVESVAELSEASDSLKDSFDSITNTDFYKKEALKKAFADFDEVRGSLSYSEYIQSEIGNIKAAQEFLTEDRLSLLLSKNTEDIQAQTELISQFSDVTGKTFAMGAEEALNYIEAIELVAEAMANSRENMESFVDSFRTDFDRLTLQSKDLGTPISKTYDDLRNVYEVLKEGLGGLTDEELAFLELNKEYIDSLNEAAEDSKDALADNNDALNDRLKLLKEELALLETSNKNIETFVLSFMDSEQAMRRLGDQLGVDIPETLDELVTTFELLSTDADGLTASELKLIAANKKYLEGLDDTADKLKEMKADISALNSILTSLGNIIDTLTDVVDTNETSIGRFNEAISIALDTNPLDEKFKEYIDNAVKYSSALFEDENFASSYESKYAKALALNQFEELESRTMSELDYLEIQTEILEDIEANTDATYQAIVLQISAIADSIQSSNNTVAEGLDNQIAALEAALESSKSTAALESSESNAASGADTNWQPSTSDTNPFKSTASYGSAIETAYSQVLGRSSVDAAGMQYWTNQLETGAITMESLNTSVAHGAIANPGDLAGVDEYKAKTNAYKYLGEVNPGMAALSTVEQQGLMSKAEAITQLYLSSLGKYPDAAGLEYWVNDPTSIADIAEIFMTSFGGKGFQSGGYTGDMGVNDIAGIVHGQEYVVDAPTTRTLGLNGSGGIFLDILAELKALREEVKVVQEVGSVSAMYNKRTSDALEGSISGRTPFKTET